jgi:hypothetical protein
LPSFWAICDETPSPNEIVRKKRGSKPGGKKRQKAAMNLSQFVALTCRLLPPAMMHTAVAPEGTGSKSVRHLPLAQLEATTADANVARNLRNCCVTSQLNQTSFNTAQH